jgi:hypothetical protein
LANSFDDDMSFFPKTKISKFVIKNGRDKKITGEENLLFYGDICKFSSNEYKGALLTKFEINTNESKLQQQLIDQIIINSNITFNKMEYFSRSIVLTFIAIAQFAICFGINLLFFEGR